MRVSWVGAEVGSRLGALIGFPIRPVPAWQALSKRAAAVPAAWRSLSLAHRYVLAGVVAAALFASLSTFWIGEQIERSHMHDRMQAVRALAREVVGPLVQTLPATGALAPDAAAAFDGLLTTTSGQLAVMRILLHDGSLVYASGRQDGTDVHALEQELGVALFETTVPLYKTGTNELIAVAHMYGVADDAAESGWARARTWIVMALLAVAMMTVPYNIVQGASAVIARQKRVIAGQKVQEARLQARSEALRKLADMVHKRGQEQNERMLRRIGSDLHDGPAQHLALVLLRLDELAPLADRQETATSAAPRNILPTIRRATADALKEIRHISAGLALPELQKISLTDALKIAVRAHQRATGTHVATVIRELPARMPLPITICLYRFAQEALNNAFRHAEGKGQRLRASYEGGTIVVEVSDSGPGFVVERAVTGGERLGLSGLRYRVESLGGTLEINSVVGQGARLTVRFRNLLG